MTFKQHVCVQASKALKVTNALSCFGNTIRGISSLISKQVISAYVLPIAHFGATTWWPDKTREKGNRTISNRVGTHLEMLDKVYRAASRAILPVYRTTPSVALYRETGIGPAELILESLSRRAAMRTRRLDPFHPLLIKSHKLATSPAVTRFARALKNLPPSEEIGPISIPPWEIFGSPNKLSTSSLDFSAPLSRRAGVFRNFYNSLSKNDIFVYSDGSKTDEGNLGIGFAIFQMDRQIGTGAQLLGKNNEVYDAEAHAALLGVRTALAFSTTHFANNL